MDFFKLCVTFILDVFYSFSQTVFFSALIYALMISFAWITLWRLIKWRK